METMTWEMIEYEGKFHLLKKLIWIKFNLYGLTGSASACLLIIFLGITVKKFDQRKMERGKHF